MKWQFSRIEESTYLVQRRVELAIGCPQFVHARWVMTPIVNLFLEIWE